MRPRSKLKMAPLMMEETRARELTFGDDYIPLLFPEEDWTFQHETSLPNHPRLSSTLTLRENRLSYYTANDLKGEACSPGLVVPSTSEMDVRICDASSGESSALNTTTQSNPSQYLQTASQLAETSVDSLRSTDISLPSPIAQVIASGRAAERERSGRIRLTSISSQAIPVKLDAFEASSSAKIQYPNEASVNSIVHAPPDPRPRRLAPSDLVTVEKIQTKGNASPPKPI
jgi:hypothetical protein